ncbi:proline rich protein [Rhodococcus rhodnii LMG 5362]|uniref:Proline rich protein n=2 Tax=Rhodococcus rhodnii TaxID=38312 RepID=R7WQE5_9NOCA|nr:proline rich protein [Rhodococcus rhodnii LMG 5362]
MGEYGGGPSGPMGRPELSVGAAISYGWKKFADNWMIWVGILLIAAVIQVILGLIFPSNFDTERLTGGEAAAFSVWSLIGSLVTAVVGILIQAALVRGALHEVDGNKPAFGSFFQFSNIGAVILASILVGVLTTIGFILFIIPGFVVIFLTWWTLQFVIDQNQNAIEGIKSSVRAISQNFGFVLGLAVLLFLINLVGVIPFGLGLLVTVPLTLIASTYAYRVITARYVSAVA